MRKHNKGIHVLFRLKLLHFDVILVCALLCNVVQNYDEYYLSKYMIIIVVMVYSRPLEDSAQL